MRVNGTNPTVLVPGFAGGNLPFLPFREELRARGIAADCWRRSPILYRRRIDWHGHRLMEDLLRLRAERGTPLTGVGWSEGGHVLVSAMRQLSERVADPEDVVRRAITYGSPFLGTWAAHAGILVDPLLRFSVREMRRGSATLAGQLAFLRLPRRWTFHAIYGTGDWLVRPVREGLDPAWCLYGPWDHRSLLWRPDLFDLIHKLIERP